MNKKMSKRQKDMKSKLMAAICMLLVSSIMMVSTTYAWFTLSTAPEVTGITTAVGANGNLEMALLKSNANFNSLDTDITSGTSDSMEATGKLIKEANVTWGNLVDLSDTTTYGLNQIQLYPASLNKGEDDTKIINTAPLKRPVYGADGRVSSLTSTGVGSGIYNGTVFNIGSNQEYGVRAVGSASSMSPRKAEYRTQIQTGTSSKESARGYARSSLQTNGGTLAGIAIKMANDNDSTSTYTTTEINALKEMVKELEKAVKSIEAALKSYVIAANIAPTAQETTYSATVTAIKAMELSQIAAWTDGQESGYTKPTGFDSAYQKLYNNDGTTGLARSVSNAKSSLSSLSSNDSSTYTKTQIESILKLILDPSQMTLNGFTIAQLKANPMQILSNIGNGFTAKMPSGSGAYADIADLCGDYYVGIKIPEGSKVGDYDIGGLDVTMQTATSQTTSMLDTVKNGITFIDAESSGSSTNAITDFYGYIVDLAFRTNAANSELRLQTDAIDRIYGEEGKNENVQGGGSSMTFKSLDDDFRNENVKELMKHIRVIFFETESGNILAEARLDTSNSSLSAEGVTAPLKVYGTTQWKKTEGFVGEKTTTDTSTSIAGEENGKSGEENLTTQDKAGTESPSIDTGSAGDQGSGSTGSTTTLDVQTANTIVALEQNKAKAVSVLVYLDGNSISNADVAATAEASMTGSMNLQFSSSANLVPMEYSDLMDGDAKQISTTSLKPVLGDSAKTAGITASAAYAITSDGKTAVAVMLRGVEKTNEENIYLKIGSTSAVKATKSGYNGIEGYGIAYTGETLAVNTEVTIYVGDPATSNS